MNADITERVFLAALVTVSLVGPLPDDPVAAPQRMAKWLELIRGFDPALARLSDAELSQALTQI
jgi:hypothetical protein